MPKNVSKQLFNAWDQPAEHSVVRTPGMSFFIHYRILYVLLFVLPIVLDSGSGGGGGIPFKSDGGDCQKF